MTGGGFRWCATEKLIIPSKYNSKANFWEKSSLCSIISLAVFAAYLGSWIDIASSYKYQEQPGRDCLYFNHAAHGTFTALRCLCRTAEPSQTRCYMLLPNGQSDRCCEAVAACCRWLVSGPNPSDQGDFLRFHANPCSMLLDSKH